MARPRRQRRADQPGRLEGKSPIKAAAFSVVMEGPTHGHGVVAKVNEMMGIWGVLPKHIYDFLKSLERDGLIQHRIEPISDPPGFRKIYHMTDAAGQARQDWFDSRPWLSVLRADIHARLAFSDEDDLPALLRALGEYREDLLELIQENKRTWAAPKGTWRGSVVAHLRAEVDKQCKAEIEWVNDVVKDFKKRQAERER